jgi:UDP-GlcNAc3NAcA epimerase
MKIASVVGARPNFIKLAPIYKALCGYVNHITIHTGQHHDYRLSKKFFKEFELPEPTFNLDIGSKTPCLQIGQMIENLEKIFLDYNNKLKYVLVYGDTNSTFAAALSAAKSGIRVDHVEAGLRAFDRRMPEEINRILTDQLSNCLFASTVTATKNLEREHVFGKIAVLNWMPPVQHKKPIFGEGKTSLTVARKK